MHADLAALKFLAMVERDLGAGGLRPLQEYLAEFPDHAALVTAEYRRLTEPDATPRAATASTTDRLLGGRYRVLASLGRGGFGEVYLADDTTLDRKVAIKVLAGLRALNREWRERLVREATITGRIDDDGLCPVHDVGFEDGTPFLVMPWINGRSLAQLLTGAEERGAPPLQLPGDHAISQRRDALLQFFERLARTLHAAHLIGVVHRDVKPGNILVRAQGQPVLIDFGLAWLSDGGLSDGGRSDGGLPDGGLSKGGEVHSSSVQLGTPVYAAPELQRPGATPSPTSDVYSLGVVLFECLTFERPFAGGRRTPQDPLPRLPRHHGPALQAIVEAALAEDPQRRYPSAAHLADDLRALRESRPISVRPAGALRRTHLWLRARVAHLAILTLIGMGLLLAFAWGVTAWTNHTTHHRAIQRAAALHRDLDLLLGEAGEPPGTGLETAERLPRALALLAGLRADRAGAPPIAAVDRHLAQMCDTTAGFAIREGELEHGRALAEEAVQLLRELSRDDAALATDRQALAHALILVGDSWANHYAHDTALGYFEAAQRLDEQLLAAARDDPTRISNVGFGLVRIGRALRISKLPDPMQPDPVALRSLEAGIAMLRRAADLEHNRAARVAHLIDGLLELAMSLGAWRLDPERYREVVQECDRLSREVCERLPGDPTAWRIRAEGLMRDHETWQAGKGSPSRSLEAVQAARRAAELEPTTTRSHLLVAGSLLLHAETVLYHGDSAAAREHAEAALQTLDRAFSRSSLQLPAHSDRLKSVALLARIAARDGSTAQLGRLRHQAITLAASAWPGSSPWRRTGLAVQLMNDWLAAHGGAQALLALEQHYATPPDRRTRRLDDLLQRAAELDR